MRTSAGQCATFFWGFLHKVYDLTHLTERPLEGPNHHHVSTLQHLGSAQPGMCSWTTFSVCMSCLLCTKFVNWHAANYKRRFSETNHHHRNVKLGTNSSGSLGQLLFPLNLSPLRQWGRYKTHFLNCFRKMPTFIPLLESRMLIWKQMKDTKGDVWFTVVLVIFTMKHTYISIYPYPLHPFLLLLQVVVASVTHTNPSFPPPMVILWDCEIPTGLTCGSSSLINNSLYILPLTGDSTVRTFLKRLPSQDLIIAFK